MKENRKITSTYVIKNSGFIVEMKKMCYINEEFNSSFNMSNESEIAFAT